jgi:hypothetical protein
MSISSEKFWRLTMQEYWLLLLKVIDEQKRSEEELKEKIFLHADMKAHIANFSMYKKMGGGQWTADDFIKKPVQDAPKEKLTLKKAKQSLGSKFIMHSN